MFKGPLEMYWKIIVFQKYNQIKIVHNTENSNWDSSSAQFKFWHYETVFVKV